MSWVCKNCGSDDIASEEEATVWATIDIDEDGNHDWPLGVNGDPEWETIGFVCRACFWVEKELADLIVQAPAEEPSAA